MKSRRSDKAQLTLYWYWVSLTPDSNSWEYDSTAFRERGIFTTMTRVMSHSGLYVVSSGKHTTGPSLCATNFHDRSGISPDIRYSAVMLIRPVLDILAINSIVRRYTIGYHFTGVHTSPWLHSCLNFVVLDTEPHCDENRSVFSRSVCCTHGLRPHILQWPNILHNRDNVTLTESNT